MPFTDRAKLELDFHRLYVPTLGCFLKTRVNPLVTTPLELQTALVVFRASPYSVPERLLRVADELDLLAPLPPLPPVVDRYSSATYALLTPTVGDIIRIGTGSYYVPPVWTHLHAYAPGVHEYTVMDASDPTNLLVSPSFPDYGEAIDFYVYRPSTFTEVIPMLTPAGDGVADRDYSVTPMAIEYFAQEHYDFVDMSVDVAMNLIDSLRSQAQSIVTALNQDSYTGDSVETFV